MLGSNYFSSLVLGVRFNHLSLGCFVSVFHISSQFVWFHNILLEQNVTYKYSVEKKQNAQKAI